MWAAQWYSNNRLDGERTHLLMENRLPVLFRTKQECSKYIHREFGYIAKRKDLRAEPHGWRMPQPVKVGIVVI